MHIKFLRHGTGSTSAAVEYLLGERDHKGSPRPLVKVMRGDPFLVALVADGLSQKWKYSSAVVSFHADDQPTLAQLEEAMGAFETAAFGNQPRENFAFAWVSHGDHLHFICARTRLDNGKSFNPAPPGSLRRYDLCRDWLNLKNQWARPDDPARARAGRAADSADHFDRVMGESTAAARRWVDSRVRTMVLNGSISSRDDLLSWLSSKGFVVTRSGKSVSIESPQGKRLRLSGAPFYAKDFDPIQAQAYRLAQSQTPQQQPASQEEVKSAEAAFAEAVARWNACLAGKPRPKPAPKPAPAPALVPMPVQPIILPTPIPHPKERSTPMSPPTHPRHNPLLAGFTLPSPSTLESHHDDERAEIDNRLRAISESTARRLRQLALAIAAHRRRTGGPAIPGAAVGSYHPAPDDGDAEGKDGRREEGTLRRTSTSHRFDERNQSDATKPIAQNVDPVADIREILRRYPFVEGLIDSSIRARQAWQERKHQIAQKALARQRAAALLKSSPWLADGGGSKPQHKAPGYSPWGSGPRPR